ncbi:hypothetical protein MHK_004935 [Candidatus Magnetomorum sp. HK-1]|nr:hypothetical protein MHK_004935 [Candidatus Magnetomorum sp. HK-1]
MDWVNLSTKELQKINSELDDFFLQRISIEKRLKGIKPEDRLKGIKPEELKAIEAYLNTMKKKMY